MIVAERASRSDSMPTGRTALSAHMPSPLQYARPLPSICNTTGAVKGGAGMHGASSSGAASGIVRYAHHMLCRHAKYDGRTLMSTRGAERQRLLPGNGTCVAAAGESKA